jgi:hypothetical protein
MRRGNSRARRPTTFEDFSNNRGKPRKLLKSRSVESWISSRRPARDGARRRPDGLVPGRICCVRSAAAGPGIASIRALPVRRPVTFSATGTPPPPAAADGDPDDRGWRHQTGPVNTQPAGSYRVRVTDANGNPSGDLRIDFAVLTGSSSRALSGRAADPCRRSCRRSRRRARSRPRRRAPRRKASSRSSPLPGSSRRSRAGSWRGRR